MTRLNYVKKLRAEGYTLQRIGDSLKPKITRERVRQILNEEPSLRCIKHDRFYKKVCLYCETENVYSLALEQLKKDDLISECRRLSLPNRSKTVVLQRIMLVKKLRKEYHLSYPQIGRLLKRHHTSVLHLDQK